MERSEDAARGRGVGEQGRRGRDAEERECDRVVTEGESGALCVCA